METLISNQANFVLLLLFIGSLCILSKSTDVLADYSVSVAEKLGISELIIGATIVSVGTSLPEFATSIISVAKEGTDFALGNAVGSIITNTSLILGVGSLTGRIPVSKTVSKRFFFLISCAFFLIVVSLLNRGDGSQYFEGHLSQYFGILYLLLLPMYLFFSFRKTNAIQDKHKVKKAWGKIELFKKLFIILLSAGLVSISAAVLVSTVSVSASRIGISEAIISSTIVALGTSLPELSTTYSASRKGYGSLALGNVIGANVMNLLLVLGSSIALTSGGIVVPNIFYKVQFPVMMGVLLLIYYFIFNSKKHEITKKEGMFLLSVYVIYLLLNIWVR